MKYTLNQLKQGENGKIIGFEGGFGLKDKLDALGLREGTYITKISDAFIGGPVTIKINNTKLAIGNGMADKIIVEVDI